MNVAVAGQYSSATEVRLATWLIRVCALLRASRLGSFYEAENQRVQGDREDRTGHSPVLPLLGQETEDTEPEEVLAHVLSSGIRPAGSQRACQGRRGVSVKRQSGANLGCGSEGAQTSSDDSKRQEQTA